MPESAAAPGIDSCNRWGERACADALAELLLLVPNARAGTTGEDARSSEAMRESGGLNEQPHWRELT
jgi:hypothetical protein